MFLLVSRQADLLDPADMNDDAGLILRCKGDDDAYLMARCKVEAKVQGEPGAQT